MLGVTLISGHAVASCKDVSRADLESAVKLASSASTGGYGLPMWVTMVDETGMVCHVVNSSGSNAQGKSDQSWLGSRVISAQKANTANAFSLDGYAISTANLNSAVNPGGSLYGLQHSNPVDASRTYGGSPSAYGTTKDPLTGKRVGGVNVFGGGLALYGGGKKIGAIGVSGDTSCRDHAYAWQVRGGLSAHPAGTGITTVNMDASGAVQTKLTGAAKGDEMILNLDGAANYWDAWSQPGCPNSANAATAANGTIKN